MIPVCCCLSKRNRGLYELFLLTIFLCCSFQKDRSREQSGPGVLHSTEENIPVTTDSQFVLHEERPAEAKPVLDMTGGNKYLIWVMGG